MGETLLVSPGHTFYIETEALLASTLESGSQIGVEDSSRNLSNKIARDGFLAGFMLRCLEAIGCEILRLS